MAQPGSNIFRVDLAVPLLQLSQAVGENVQYISLELGKADRKGFEYTVLKTAFSPSSSSFRWPGDNAFLVFLMLAMLYDLC